MAAGALRLALLGAFPFPYPQGSQIFFAEQARALAKAGARVTLITYASGAGTVDPAFDHVTPPAWTAPREMRSGPHPGKPLADAALVHAYLEAHRRRHFDVTISHNVEAALVALAARTLCGVPVVYCAHTILAHELSAYLPVALAGAADRLGDVVDRFVTRRVDGVISLSPAAAETLRSISRAPPLAVLPPGLERAPAPSTEAQAAACARHGLEPHTFALYSGNLDGYQELALFDAAAGALGSTGAPCVLASHDREAAGRARRQGLRHVRPVFVGDRNEMRALCFAAGVLVMTRRRPGGFPIKLLNYMETGRPIVAFKGIAVGMRHQENAWLIRQTGGVGAIVEGIGELLANETLAQKIGQGAARLLDERHRWAPLAAQTLAFLQEVISTRVA